MQPELALTFTSLFVIIIIYVEHKHSRERSIATWISAIWLLYSASKQLGTWLNIHSTIEAGSLPDRYFLLGLGALGFFILLKRHFLWRETLKKNHLLIFIIFYMLISTAWSRVPGISFRRWGREAIALIIACLLLSEKCPLKSLISVLMKVIYISLPFSLLLVKYYGTYGCQYNKFSGELMWVGIAGQKNGLALICSFSAIFLIWSLSKDLSQWTSLPSKIPVLINLFMLVLSIYLMMGPRRTLKYSSTSFISLLMGLILIMILRILTDKKIKIQAALIIIAITIILIGTFMPFTGKIPIKGIPELLGRDSTLTGRTQIWNSLVPYAKKKLILGYGFGGFWTTSLIEQIAVSAHNGYLDTILSLGFAGLLIFLIFLITLLLKCYKLIRGPWDIHILFLSMVFIFLIHNVAETSLGHLGSFPSSLIVLSSLIINSAESNIEDDPENNQEIYTP